MADDRHDLLSAINSFLDCSIVLPPSEMGGDELLRSVARFQREMLAKRQEQGVKLVKEPKSMEEKGNSSNNLIKPYRRKRRLLFHVILSIAVDDPLLPVTQRPSSRP